MMGLIFAICFPFVVFALILGICYLTGRFSIHEYIEDDGEDLDDC